MLTGRTASMRKAGLLRYGLTVVFGLAAIGALAWFLVGGAQSGPNESEIAGLLQARPGGDTTIETTNRNSFGLAAPNLTNPERRVFEVGDSFFTQNWVTAPASTEARDGLGPTFNAQSARRAIRWAGGPNHRTTPMTRSEACCSGSAYRALTRPPGRRCPIQDTAANSRTGEYSPFLRKGGP